MDPFTLVTGLTSLAGIGLKAYGANKQVSAAKEQSNISSNIAGLEQNVNDQRAQAMEISARRQQMENIRKTQLAQSMAVNTSTGQGAQFSSSAATGASEATSAGFTNALGINQNLMLGRNVFALDRQISGQKIALAGVQSKAATASGYSSLGGALLQSAGPLGNLSGFFGKGAGTGYSEGNSGGTGGGLGGLY